MLFMAEFIHSMASSVLMYPGGATGEESGATGEESGATGEEVTGRGRGRGRALRATVGLAGVSVPGKDRQREVGGSVLEQEASWWFRVKLASLDRARGAARGTGL